MVEKVTAWKDKDGCLYEERSDAYESDLSSKLYEIFDGDELKERHQIIEFISKNPETIKNILANHINSKKKDK